MRTRGSSVAVGNQLYLLVLPLFLILLSCQTVPYPQIPPEPSQMDDSQKKQAYNDFKLERGGNFFFGTYFLQGSKPTRYPPGTIGTLFEQAGDPSKSAYNRGSGFALASTLVGSAGGSLIGWPVGTAIGRSASGISPAWTTTETILVSTGGVLVVVGIILGAVSDGAFNTAVVDYNGYLSQRYSQP